MITIEQARKVLEDRGYRMADDLARPYIYMGESTAIELREPFSEIGGAQGVRLRSRSTTKAGFIHCKTQQQLIWAIQIFELESSAYNCDWAMCEEVLGCRRN